MLTDCFPQGNWFPPIIHRGIETLGGEYESLCDQQKMRTYMVFFYWYLEVNFFVLGINRLLPPRKLVSQSFIETKIRGLMDHLYIDTRFQSRDTLDKILIFSFNILVRVSSAFVRWHWTNVSQRSVELLLCSRTTWIDWVSLALVYKFLL